jgi:hypothetical protein
MKTYKSKIGDILLLIALVFLSSFTTYEFAEQEIKTSLEDLVEWFGEDLFQGDISEKHHDAYVHSLKKCIVELDSNNTADAITRLQVMVMFLEVDIEDGHVPRSKGETHIKNIERCIHDIKASM